MNGAHLHLLINHFPIIGLFFSLVLLILHYFKPGERFLTSALVILVVSGVLAVPTFLSGDEAEDVIKNSPGFVKELVHEHEEAADFAVWWMGVTGVAAAAALYSQIKKNRIPKPLLISVVVLLLFTMTVVARTNYLGGHISHPEIRGEPASSTQIEK